MEYLVCENHTTCVPKSQKIIDETQVYTSWRGLIPCIQTKNKRKLCFLPSLNIVILSLTIQSFTLGGVEENMHVNVLVVYVYVHLQ